MHSLPGQVCELLPVESYHAAYTADTTDFRSLPGVATRKVDTWRPILNPLGYNFKLRTPEP